MCARRGAGIIAGMKWAELFPIISDTIYQGYLSVGRPEEFDEAEMVRYMSDDYIAAFGGYMGLISREKPASLILIGAFGLDNILYPEAGSRYGALMIGGQNSLGGVARFMTLCQHVLITEEMYAVGAYLSKDPLQTANVLTMDLMRIVNSIVLIIGSILMILGIDIITKFLKM
jgi:hypothetical protein